MATFTTLTRNIFTARRGERPSDERTWIRRVWLPSAGLLEREALLDEIYSHGQNEVQPRVAPSLSTDDLILVDDEVYRVETVGFKRVGLHALTPIERLVVRFARAALGEAVAYQEEEAERAMHAAGVDPEDIERFRAALASG